MEDDMHALIKAPSRNVTLYLLQPWVVLLEQPMVRQGWGRKQTTPAE